MHLQKWYECLKQGKLLSAKAYKRFFAENMNHYCYGLERHDRNGATMYKYKRLPAVLFLVVFLVSVGSSFAEGKSYIPCDCLSGNCTCFIQLGDEGGAVKTIVDLLIEKKYLAKGTPKGLFSEDVEKAVRRFQTDNSLEETGTMDDDTLTLFLWGMLPEDVDTKYGWSIESCKTVYLPTDGGKKRHLKETCSKMEDPRKVSDRNAEKLGFDPCGRCYK